MNKFNKILFFVNALFISVVAVAGVAFAWTNPSANPPSGNGALYSSGGNVGIGVASPTQKLDVNGYVKGTGLCIGSDCKTSWPSGSTSQWTTSGSNIYYNTGNVGVGTVSPSYPLSAHSSTDPAFGISRASGTYPTIFKQGTDNALVINNSNVDTITLKSGNVGIGTSTPRQKLDVNGLAYVGDTLLGGAYMEINNAGSGNRFAYIDFHGDDTYTDYGLRIIRGNTGADTYTQISHRGTGALILNAQEAAPITIGTSNIERMRITSTGNVGIGTTNPQNKLDVTGGLTVTGSISTGKGIGLSDEGTYKRIQSWESEPLSINPLGNNVGIGTTAPGAKFEVYSSGAGVYLNQATAGDIYMRYHVPGIKWWTVGPKANGDFWFSNASDLSTAGPLTIKNSGDVGIGTSNPTQKLDVAGYVKGTGLCIGSDCRTSWPSGGTGTVTGTGSTNYLSKWTSGSGIGNSLIYDTGANVGIGMTLPEYKLSVNGDISAMGWLRTSGSTGWYSGTYGGGWYMADTSWIRTYGSKNIYQNAGIFRTDGTLQVGPSGDRFHVTSTGNVGIGVASPTTYKLDVNGSINSNTFIRASTNSSSYASGAFNASTGATSSALYGDSGNWGAYGKGTVAGIYGVGGASGPSWAPSAGTGVFGYGSTRGVEGGCANSSCIGIHGINGSGLGGFGVYGEAQNNPGAAGVGGLATGANSIGVAGYGDGYDFYAMGPGVNYGASSSGRWKTNVEPIKNALQKILNIRGVAFDWDKEHGGQKDIGFIGEEVGKEIPEIVVWDPKAKGFVTGMDYSKMTPVLVEAIREQQAEIELLKSEINLLKGDR